VRSTLAVLLLVLPLGACEINGSTQTYPGASVYQAPDNGFHFHFLSPPWRYAEKEQRHLVYLVVDSFSQFHRAGDVTISYKLWVSHDQSASAQVGAVALRDKALGAGKMMHTDLESFETLTGEQGWQYMAYKDDPKGERYYHRDSLLTDGHGRVVLFSLTAAYPLWEQDVDDVILSFSDGPDLDDTQTPPKRPDGGPGPDAATDAATDAGGTP